MATKRPHSDAESSITDVQAVEDEETFSMVDILAEQNELEESASAVLGGGDDKNCTYPLGYMKRQPLYSCKTCAEVGADGSVGVCLACSLHCHDNHDLVELYTKRNFRCDCGNGKFQGFSCLLEPHKTDKNEGNSYNQNFRGTYCTCERPYPDPDADEEDEMIQCCICEDWYHTRHLGAQSPSEFAEMICDSCVEKHSFVMLYATNPDFVNVEGGCSLKLMKSKSGETRANEEKKITVSTCYFDAHWRSKLCQCSDCTPLYEGITFITDETDSVDCYEKKNSSERKSQYEKGMEELSKLDRVQQVEVMTEFHDMKSELREFLGKFATSGEVVTKEHINQFFEEMNSKKRRRVAVPATCR